MGMKSVGSLKANHQRSWLRRGFTLIEILVVVAVIVVLMAILLPALNRARESAKATVCLSNLRQNGIMFMAYATDFNYIIPTGGCQYASRTPELGYAWYHFYDGTRISSVQYMKVQAMSRRCPKSRPVGVGVSSEDAYGIINHSSNSSAEFTKTILNDPYDLGHFQGVRLTLLPSPGSYVLLIDTATQSGSTVVPLRSPQSPSGGNAERFYPDMFGVGGIHYGVWMAHPLNKSNALFADGHAESLNRSGLWGVSNYNGSVYASGHHGIIAYWDNDGQPHGRSSFPP